MNSAQNLVACRYNPVHRMKSSRLLVHEEKCPDRRNKVLKICPYNPVHKVTPDQYEKHKRQCHNKPQVDPELEKELKDYLRNKTNDGNINTVETTVNYTSSVRSDMSASVWGRDVNENSYKADYQSWTDQSQSHHKTNHIPGMSNPKDISEKKEKKKDQKKMVQLIEGWGNDDVDIYIDESSNNLNINALPNITMNDDDARTQNIVDDINKYLQDTSHHNQFDNFYGADGGIGIKKYDPNESNMYIDKLNKNNIKFKDKDESQEEEEDDIFGQVYN
jgi:hypothetical protein